MEAQVRAAVQSMEPTSSSLVWGFSDPLPWWTVEKTRIGKDLEETWRLSKIFL